MSVELQDLDGHTAEKAAQRVILQAVVGSTVHGTAVEGTDDRDLMGVCIEPVDTVLGLRRFEQYTKRDRPEGVRSQPGDTDLVVYSLRKFCSLALKGNPSILLLLNVPDTACEVLTEHGRALRLMASAFASKKAGAAFLGYMQKQRERMLGLRGQKGVKRPELVERYGFDTKFAGHMIRLGIQGIQYMQYGAFAVPMYPEDAALVRSIRTGDMSYEDVLARAETLETILKAEIDHSRLPDLPNYGRVNGFLIETLLTAWMT